MVLKRVAGLVSERKRNNRGSLRRVTEEGRGADTCSSNNHPESLSNWQDKSSVTFEGKVYEVER